MTDGSAKVPIRRFSIMRTMRKVIEMVKCCVAALTGAFKRHGHPVRDEIASASLSAEFKEKLKETLRSAMKLAF